MVEFKRITPEGESLGLVYFTSNSVTEDDKVIFLVGEKNHIRNIFRINADGTDLCQLTDIPIIETKDNQLGISLSNELDTIYGEPAVDCKNGLVYYLRRNRIMRVSIDGKNEEIARLPLNTVPSVFHVSENGKKLVVATTDERAFINKSINKFTLDIDNDIQRNGYNATIHVIDTETGKEIISETVPRAWITHLQFNPANDELILYNHEWPNDCGIRRIWLFDGKKHIRVRTEGEGRNRKDWTCHEMWSRDGNALIYHGTYEDGTNYLGRADICVEHDNVDIQLREIPFPNDFNTYGHFTMGCGNDVFTDGYYCMAGEHLERSKYICKLSVDWNKKDIHWIPICEHKSTWKRQESHPHPILNHKGDLLYFNSDFEGYRAVYAVKVLDLP